MVGAPPSTETVARPRSGPLVEIHAALPAIRNACDVVARALAVVENCTLPPYEPATFWLENAPLYEVDVLLSIGAEVTVGPSVQMEQPVALQARGRHWWVPGVESVPSAMLVDALVAPEATDTGENAPPLSACSSW